MKRRKRILIGLTLSILLTTIIVAGVTAAKSPFIGAWEGNDPPPDNSYVIMNIGGGPGNYRRVIYRDFGATACGFDPDTGDFLSGATMSGWAYEDGNILSGQMDLYCSTNPPRLWGPVNFFVTYFPDEDILQGLVVTWERK